MTRQAWVTLATNDTYALGALVLAHSLRGVDTAHELVVLITPGVTPAMRDQLSSVFNLVQEVDVLDSGDAANLALLARPDLGITFTKLHCWRLTQYTKCVFLDADTLVLDNCDELFLREELSAAPDAGWPDCFNSGVFVYTPSNETFTALIQFALAHGSFDGGDQGLLNMFFKDWATSDIRKHLPFIYNMCSTSTYTYLPAFKYFGDKVKIVHFIGSGKPWMRLSESTSSISDYVQRWWSIFQSRVSTVLSSEMSLQRPSSCYVLSSSYYNSVLIEKPPPKEDRPYVFSDPWESYTEDLPTNTLTTASEEHAPLTEPDLTEPPEPPAPKTASNDCLVCTYSDTTIHSSPDNTNETPQLDDLKRESPSPILNPPNVIESPDLDDKSNGEVDAQQMNGGLAGILGSGDIAIDDALRKQNWEQGNIDYMGRDSFENIWKKIASSLNISEKMSSMQAVFIGDAQPMPAEPEEVKEKEIDESKRAVLVDPPQEVPEDPPLPTHPSQLRVVEKPPMALVEAPKTAGGDQPKPSPKKKGPAPSPKDQGKEKK